MQVRKQQLELDIYMEFRKIVMTTLYARQQKRQEYKTIWPASWEVYMQVKKQQLELDMEQ